MTSKSGASGKLGFGFLEPFQMEKGVLDRRDLALSSLSDFWAPCQKGSGVQDMPMSAQLVMSPRKISNATKFI